MSGLLTDRQWLWLAGGFYLAGFLLGTRFLRRGGRPSGVLLYGLILVGYAMQMIGMYVRGHAAGGCPLGNTFEMVQFTAWSAITLYLAVGVTFRSSILGFFTAGLGAALTLVSLVVRGWDATRRTHVFGGNPWIEFHAALALFSFGVFGLLALTSAMFLFRHHSLKSKHLGGWFSFLPSILDLDQIGVRLLAFGVVLLGTSLSIGMIYWTRTSRSVDATLLITAGVWVAYAAAWGLRAKGRLLAQRFAWMCLGLFAAALISLGTVNASMHATKVVRIRNLTIGRCCALGTATVTKSATS